MPEHDNLNPHAEAKLAMWMWCDEYAAQRGGTMDFWAALTPNRQRICARIVDDVLEAAAKRGRVEAS